MGGTRGIGQYAPAIVWALAILILSVLPSQELPQANFRLADKVAHFIVYGILSVLLIRDHYKRAAQITSVFRGCMLLFLISAFYGILMEIIQELFCPTRFGEWHDALANMIGSFFGLVIGVAMLKRKQ